MLHKIDVTRDIIDKSFGRSGSRCMVYNALRPIIRPDVEFVVGIYDFSLEDTTARIPLPENIHQIVSDHYDGKVVEPFSFEIDLPEGLTNAAGTNYHQSEGD